MYGWWLQMLPSLSRLPLATAPSPRFVSHEADVGAGVPESAVAKQFKDGKLIAGAKGVIASAGLSKKGGMKTLIANRIPSSAWKDEGWMYAYWEGVDVSPGLVLDLHNRQIAFSLIGGAKVLPRKFVIALIERYWGKGMGSERQSGKGTLLDLFDRDDDGSFTKGFFSYILNDAVGMSHWKRNHFKDVDEVLAAVRAGKALPIAWFDDGMDFLARYVRANQRAASSKKGL